MTLELTRSLITFCRDPTVPESDILNQILRLQLPANKVVSVLGQMLDVAKSAFNPEVDAIGRLRNLYTSLLTQNEEYVPLLLLRCSRADLGRSPTHGQFWHIFILESRGRTTLPNCATFADWPMAWAFFLNIIAGDSPPNVLLAAIGDYNLDPKTVFSLLVAAVRRKPDPIRASFFSVFPAGAILKFWLDALETDSSASAAAGLYSFANGSPEQLFSIIGHPSILAPLFLQLSDHATVYARDLSRVRTVMPGTTKAESYPQSYFDHKHLYESALSALLQSTHFRVLSIVSGASVLSFARSLCSFDCCLCDSFSPPLSTSLHLSPPLSTSFHIL
jgi:hypothetical protein